MNESGGVQETGGPGLTSPSPFSFAPGERLRLAEPKDNAALLRLFESVPMRGDLVLTTERSPDFFALYALQRGDAECWVFEKNGEVRGCSTVIVRDGWLEGNRCKVAYLGDLRAGAGARGVVHRYYGALLQSVADRYGVAAFYTGILASNEAALRALTRRTSKRRAQPAYHLFRRYDAVQIHFTVPRRLSKGPIQIRTATAQDVARVSAFLHGDHQRRPFGLCFDRGEFEHRLCHWPGYSLQDTYLALDRNQGLLGVTTVWDAAAVKRYRVEEYRGNMRWVKRLLQGSSWLLGHAPLPERGECFRYAYLSNLSVLGDDPAVLRALLLRIYDDHRRRGLNFMMLYLEEGSPMATALSGFQAQRLPFLQYEVTEAGQPPPPSRVGTSGFEIALA